MNNDRLGSTRGAMNGAAAIRRYPGCPTSSRWLMMLGMYCIEVNSTYLSVSSPQERFAGVAWLGNAALSSGGRKMEDDLLE